MGGFVHEINTISSKIKIKSLKKKKTLKYNFWTLDFFMF